MILSLDEDPNLDADNNDMLKAAGCLLAAVQKGSTKTSQKRNKLQETSVHCIEACFNAQVPCHRRLIHVTDIWVPGSTTPHSCVRGMSGHI